MILFLCVKGKMVWQGVRIVFLMNFQGVRVVTFVFGIHIVTVRRRDNSWRSSSIIVFGRIETTIILVWVIRRFVGDAICDDSIYNSSGK